MENLSNSIVTKDVEDGPKVIGITEKIDDMVNKNRISEAFFIVRRMAAEGDQEAKLLVDKLLGLMKNE